MLKLKFSQPTRHEKIAKKTPESAVAQAFAHLPQKANVTLVSNPEMSCHAAKKIPKGASPSVAEDCATLSKMALRERYQGEANSHRNMLSRQKAKGAVVHPDFMDFASFLRIVGPMPAKGATLDRIQNADPEYAPGKVRWADKRTQNNNKGDTLVFNYSRTGDTYTSSRIAKLQKVSASTIRKRAERGWTDDEIIEGKRASSKPVAGAVTPMKVSPEIHPVQFVANISTSAAEIAFQREAARFQAHREMYDGEEAVMAPYEDVIAFDERLRDLPLEKYERRFAKFWPSYRPHVIFDAIAESQRQIVSRIDPEYYEAWKQSKAIKAEVVSKL
ncbi:hypothetical protein LRX75_15450 [Rhizobium sp. DKSPLA3]|uniref:Uncharacterized protein n=1 Tax=Rhizobium quercicola TaxID=2901226 RepID=A0A9X1NVE5_9HYPH|nr:hypothetical protein [Rhizobium quercicola]MCD7110434.1 hypothetical protein [Rhizobium quercicola]